MFFPVSLPPLARHSRKESCFPRHPFQQLSTWNVWSQSSPTLTPNVCPVLTPPPRYSCLASLASVLPPTRSGWTLKLSHVCSVTNPLEAQRHHGPFLPASTWFTVVVSPPPRFRHGARASVHGAGVGGTLMDSVELPLLPGTSCGSLSSASHLSL